MRLDMHTIAMAAVQSSSVTITAGQRFISGTFDTRVSPLQSCSQYSFPFPTYYSVRLFHLTEAQHMLKLQNLTHLPHQK
jgi:hypothetical protein